MNSSFSSSRCGAIVVGVPGRIYFGGHSSSEASSSGNALLYSALYEDDDATSKRRKTAEHQLGSSALLEMKTSKR
uniref:Uncharacterized protein n=1 Tax=Angiostrongylus cantonensis TaxID=6313 RepID=A0A0K0CYQ9_ANGCA